jgi:hypothetical protein
MNAGNSTYLVHACYWAVHLHLGRRRPWKAGCDAYAVGGSGAARQMYADLRAPDLLQSVASKARVNEFRKETLRDPRRDACNGWRAACGLRAWAIPTRL